MGRYTAAVAAALTTSLCGCALYPYQFEDPIHILGVGPDVKDIVKSLKCEITTFIVANKLRSQVYQDASVNIHDEYFKDPDLYNQHIAIMKQNSYTNLDDQQLASVIVEFKNIDTASISLGYDNKIPNLTAPKTSLDASNLVDYHAGPSYSDTRTFDYTIPMGIPQNSDLGPAETYEVVKNSTPLASQYTTAYYFQPPNEDGFYCYKSLGDRTISRGIVDAAADIQHLVESDDPVLRRYETFTRVRMNGVGKTLAKWLQDAATESQVNQTSVFVSTEALFVGQLSYVMTLDAKPGLDLKYTLAAGTINPLVP